MKFHQDWLLEDSTEVLTNLNSEVYTKDEIEKLSVKENISELEKARILLENGQNFQKVWVAKNLDILMHESKFDEIIAELLNRLPYWHDSSQEEAGRSILKVISHKRFPIKYSEYLLNLSLEIIDTETWTLQKVWGEVIAEISRQLPDNLLQICTQETLKLVAFDKTSQVRSIGGYILGVILEITKNPSIEITNKIYLMTQDPSSFVRKNMCGTLKILFKISDQCDEKVITEIIKLVGDECVEVLEESLQLLLDVLPDINNKSALLESIGEYFVKTGYDRLVTVKLKFVGRILKGFHSCMDNDVKGKWVDWITNMVESGGIQDKRSIALSIGAIISCIDMDIRLIALWNTLESENDIEIQNTLTLQIGYLATKARGKQKEIQSIIRKYLKSNDDLLITIPQFSFISSSLDMLQEVSEILIDKFNTKLKIRETLAVIDQIILFTKDFDCINFVKNLIPSLIECIKNSVLPIREKSLELLAVVLYKLPVFSNKVGLSKEIITTFAKSTRGFDRASYLHFCLFIRHYFSKKFFCKHFMDSLLAIGKDKETLVRYKFAQNYCVFRYLVPANHSELEINFQVILNSYLGTGDKVLIDYATKAQQMMNQENWELNYGPKSEILENQKLKQELDEETKETSYSEKVKKNDIKDTLYEKTRIVKRNTICPKKVLRQSSVKPIKKYNLGEPEKHDTSLNKKIVKMPRRK